MGGERIWLTFIDAPNHLGEWRGLVRLPPLPTDRARTIKVDLSMQSGRVNMDHLYQIVISFGGMAWDEPLNPDGATIVVEGIAFIPNDDLEQSEAGDAD